MVAVPTSEQGDLPFPADKYVKVSRKWLGKSFIADPSLKKVADGKVVGKTIIDIGCGDGSLAQVLAQMGANKVVGIDSCHEMILSCRARYNCKFWFLICLKLSSRIFSKKQKKFLCLFKTIKMETSYFFYYIFFVC